MKKDEAISYGLSILNQTRRGMEEKQRIRARYEKVLARANGKLSNIKEHCSNSGHSIVLNIGRTSAEATEDTYMCAFCGEYSEGFNEEKFGESTIIDVSGYRDSIAYIGDQNILYRAITNFIQSHADSMSTYDLKRHIEANYIVIADALKSAESEKRKRLMGY